MTFILSGACRPELGMRYDGDGDGVTVAGGDCDDTNPAVHRGAFERPFDGDDLDQNCDGFEVCTDFNCDGWPDVLLPGLNTVTEWMAGGPDRRWTLGGVLPGPSYANLPAAGDLNGDGYLDIALPNWPEGAATDPALIFWGIGDGFAETPTKLWGPKYRAARIGDVDQDGDADLLWVAREAASDGGIGSTLLWGPIAPSIFPLSLSNAVILEGVCSSDGIFVRLEDETSLAAVLTIEECVTDFGFRIFERPADNTYYSDQLGACPPITLSSGDYNGDGRQDLSLGCWQAGGHLGELWFGVPGGSFAQYPIIVEREGVPAGPYTGTADLDGDGDPDWAWGLFDGARPIGVELFENAGDGLPIPAVLIDAEAWQFALSDLDIDGEVDLLLSMDGLGTRVYWGEGDWAWSSSSAPLSSVAHATPVVCPGSERCYIPEH